MYRLIFKLVFARLDAESAHRFGFAAIRLMAATGVGTLIRRRAAPDPSLSVSTLGLKFESPFGMAAGFDKEGTGLRGLWQLGFGHIEVGTITAIAQPGNERPRLFRLIADRAVINRMGFNNHGAARTARVLERARRLRGRPVIGVNIGKSRVVSLADATADYLTSTRILAPLADYLVVNVSSPNTPGLRDLQELDRLGPLLAAVKIAAGSTPVLVKIAPDLADVDVTAIARLAAGTLDGIIATNTTLGREGLRSSAPAVAAAGAGGLSGAPLAARSLELLRLIRGCVPAEFCVISVGGVETAADVRERLAAGATLVQGYTAFLYEGPLWAATITRDLTRTATSRSGSAGPRGRRAAPTR